MFSLFSKSIILLVFILLVISCDEYEFPASPYPRVETLTVANISASGVVFQGNISFLGSGKIIDHGFVWGFNEELSVNRDGVVRLGQVTSMGIFTANIDSGLYPDTTYYLKSFVSTDQYFVYGSVLSFRSKGSTPPVISEIIPSEGTWGDTVQLKGKYFSSLAKNNSVKFGSFNSLVVKSNDSIITCVVPENITDNSVPVSVTVTGNQTLSASNFTFLSPNIENFSPQLGTFDDILTITGKNFSASLEKNIVKFNQHTATVLEASKTTIKVKVPRAIPTKESSIQVTVNLRTATASDAFTLLGPQINSLSSNAGYIGDLLEITGDNFNPDKNQNTLHIGNSLIPIISATRNKLLVQIPNTFYDSRMINSFRVAVAEQVYTLNETFTIKNAWLRKSAVPPTGDRILSVAFAINNKGYVGLGLKTGVIFNDFWEYDPETNNWSSMGAFPGESRLDAFGFSVGDYGYVGGGTSRQNGQPLYDFWRFDPTNNSWTQLNDLPVEMIRATLISLGNKAFAIFNESSDFPYQYPTECFWEYSSTTDEWMSKQNGCSSFPILTGLGYGDYLYILDRDIYTAQLRLSKADITSQPPGWEASDELTYYQSDYQDATSFRINTFGYFLLENGIVSKYDFEASTLSEYSDGPNDSSGPRPVSFVINEKAYVWTGAFLLEFDPVYEN